jgi:hypothetical protein
MALDFSDVGEENIKIVLSCDPSIGEDADYEAYIQSLDESHLKLVGEPTRFLMRKRLKYAVSQKLKQSQMEYSGGGDAKMNGAFYMEEVRMRWCGIEQPAGAKPVEFKKAGDGGAHPEMMEKLEDKNGTLELYTGCQLSIKSSQNELKKKS